MPFANDCQNVSEYVPEASVPAADMFTPPPWSDASLKTTPVGPEPLGGISAGSG